MGPFAISYLPTPEAEGRPRTHSLRDILDAIFYVLKKWLSLAAFAPRRSSMVYRLLPFQEIPIEWVVVSHPQSPAHTAERNRAGKDPQPTAAIMDSQSVKTVEESAHPSGYDAHKNLKGRKRHLLVDTLGLPLSVYLTSADVQDRAGARCLLAGL